MLEKEKIDFQQGVWPMHLDNNFLHIGELQTLMWRSSESTRYSSVTDEHHGPKAIVLSDLLQEQPTQQQAKEEWHLGSSPDVEECPEHVVWSDPSSDESSLESESSSDSDDDEVPQRDYGPPVEPSTQRSKPIYFSGKPQGNLPRQLSSSVVREQPSKQCLTVSTLPNSAIQMMPEADTVHPVSLGMVNAMQPSWPAGFKFHSIGHMLAWASLAQMMVGSSFLGTQVIPWPVHATVAHRGDCCPDKGG